MVYCGSGTETLNNLILSFQNSAILWSTAEAVLRP